MRSVATARDIHGLMYSPLRWGPGIVLPASLIISWHSEQEDQGCTCRRSKEMIRHPTQTAMLNKNKTRFKNACPGLRNPSMTLNGTVCSELIQSSWAPGDGAYSLSKRALPARMYSSMLTKLASNPFWVVTSCHEHSFLLSVTCSSQQYNIGSLLCFRGFLAGTSKSLNHVDTY